jgi:cutinase
MRFLNTLALAQIAAALPLEVITRQLDRTSLSESEFSRSTTCGKVVFVWARGSTEAGNMVSTKEVESVSHYQS